MVWVYNYSMEKSFLDIIISDTSHTFPVVEEWQTLINYNHCKELENKADILDRYSTKDVIRESQLTIPHSDDIILMDAISSGQELFIPKICCDTMQFRCIGYCVQGKNEEIKGTGCCQNNERSL